LSTVFFPDAAVLARIAVDEAFDLADCSPRRERSGNGTVASVVVVVWTKLSSLRDVLGEAVEVPGVPS
jgi:hypothetical protein